MGEQGARGYLHRRNKKTHTKEVLNNMSFYGGGVAHLLDWHVSNDIQITSIYDVKATHSIVSTTSYVVVHILFTIVVHT